MRTGMVFSFNPINNSGFIKDWNNQKIRFYQNHYPALFARFEIVQFEIELTEKGLIAVNVEVAKHKN